MTQRWEQLTFLHWSYAPGVVQALLPNGLTVQTYDDRAWVGLVPFHMLVAPPGVAAPAWIGRFCETNVRTYVTDRSGRTGVWFFSLDAARLPAVLAGRSAYRLPYFWARMRLEATPERVEYTSGRRWPGPRGRGGTIVVLPGAAIPSPEVTPFEHFLTARFRLFMDAKNGLRYADAEHAPWPLRRVDVEAWDDGLVTAAGLPRPDGPPLAHYSDGVDVRIGRPRAC